MPRFFRFCGISFSRLAAKKKKGTKNTSPILFAYLRICHPNLKGILLNLSFFRVALSPFILLNKFVRVSFTHLCGEMNEFEAKLRRRESVSFRFFPFESKSSQ